MIEFENGTFGMLHLEPRCYEFEALDTETYLSKVYEENDAGCNKEKLLN